MRKVPAVLVWWLKRFGGDIVANALDDPATRDLIVAWVVERLPTGFGDGVLIRDLLRFLWENKEEIIQFVITIIGLFAMEEGGRLMGATGTAQCEQFYANDEPIPFGADK